METEAPVAGTEASAPPPEVVREARELGWVPKEQFRGDTTRWVDADVFVQRGHEVMPLLKANNARLLGEVHTLKETLRETNDAIVELRKLSEETTRERVRAAKAEVMAQLKTAKEEQNVEAELALTEKLVDIRAAERADVAKPAAPPPPAPSAVDPAFTAWAARPENSWFGVDKRRTALATGIAQELRADRSNDHIVGVAFYEKVAAEVADTLGGGAPLPADRVEGSRGGSGGSGTNGSGGGTKGYNALPADAKAACDKQAKQFVGKGDFKTQTDWRTYYANLYFAE